MCLHIIQKVYFVWRALCCYYWSFLYSAIVLFSTLRQTHCTSHVLVCAWLFGCLHNPPNSDMDGRSFNIYICIHDFLHNVYYMHEVHVHTWGAGEGGGRQYAMKLFLKEECLCCRFEFVGRFNFVFVAMLVLGKADVQSIQCKVQRPLRLFFFFSFFFPFRFTCYKHMHACAHEHKHEHIYACAHTHTHTHASPSFLSSFPLPFLILPSFLT